MLFSVLVRSDDVRYCPYIALPAAVGQTLMLTTAKHRRLWQTGLYRALIRDLVTGRAEARLDLDVRLPGKVTAAALGLIRLRELDQGGNPLAKEALETLIWSQHRDGSIQEPGDDPDAVAAKTATRSPCVART